jgi:hypothetical protein
MKLSQEVSLLNHHDTIITVLDLICIGNEDDKFNFEINLQVKTQTPGARQALFPKKTESVVSSAALAAAVSRSVGQFRTWLENTPGAALTLHTATETLRAQRSKAQDGTVVM